MKVDVTDREVLASLASSNILSYLRILGWNQGFIDADRLAVYRKEIGEDFAEVLVPLRPELPDYQSAVHSLLRTVSETEGRSQLQVLSDIQNVNADIVRVRVEHLSFDDGSIPLEAGSKLIDRAIDLLVAGACAADNPKAVYASRRSTQVHDYLREARLGQTERGSYIVTMKSIVPPVLVELTGQTVIPIEEYNEPFERKVTKTLAVALAATRTAITEATASGSFDPFRLAVDSGVSANLLESIVGLISETGAVQTEVAMTWSPTRLPPPTVPSLVSFSSQDEPLLKTASNMLRESSPKPEHKIEGFVRILHRENVKAPGTITVRAIVDGKARTVRISLTPEDYRRAVEAHGDWKAIEVTGELIKQGKLCELRHPREFRIFEEESDDIENEELQEGSDLQIELAEDV